MREATSGPASWKQFPPPRAKLFCSLIFSSGLDLRSVLEVLAGEWGEVEFISQRLPFHLTRYYEKEMGASLARKFVLFLKPVPQESLPALKWAARRVEGLFLDPSGGRGVNIDPGLLLPDKLVLATTKPCAHRPYLGEGIYADLTLVFHRGGFQALAWTYPDYASEEIRAMLSTLRVRFLLQRRRGRQGADW